MFERTRLGRRGLHPDQLDTASVLVLPERTGREELPVERMADGRMRVLASPGLAQGFAADDVIVLDEDGVLVEVVERSRNVGAQVLAEALDDAGVASLVERVEALGGWLDGATDQVVVVTLPVGLGFARIEALLDEVVPALGQGVEWFYANVYDVDGETPLGWWGGRHPALEEWGEDDRLLDAVEEGDLAAARALLEAGANPDFDSFGLPIIDVAIWRSDAAMVRLLLEFGAVIDSTTEDGRRRMHLAASNPWLLGLLLELGFDPDVRDRHGWAPLHFTAAYGVAESASLLLAAGADPEPRTLTGKTPADIAAANGRPWPPEAHA